MITFFAYGAGEQHAVTDDGAASLLLSMGEKPECVGMWTIEELPAMRRKLIRALNRGTEGAEGVLGVVVLAQRARTDVVWG